MVSATFTGGIIRKYDDILSSMVALAVYIPMLMDSAGNSGSQSATMIIRGLALGEVSMKDMAKVAWKELRVGLIVGLTLASVNFTRIYFFDGVGVWVAATVSISLLFTILAKLVGGPLPIIAKSFD